MSPWHQASGQRIGSAASRDNTAATTDDLRPPADLADVRRFMLALHGPMHPPIRLGHSPAFREQRFFDVGYPSSALTDTPAGMFGVTIFYVQADIRQLGSLSDLTDLL
jgi:hypothetical protein